MTAAAPVPHRSRWETAGLALFALLFVGVAVRLLHEDDPKRQNVYLKVFVPAADAFLRGAPLYTETSGFRYPPIAAAAFVPFAWLGPLLGSIVWRAGQGLLLFVAVRTAFRRGFPVALDSRERGWFWLLVTPALIGSVNNGQANVLVLALLLLATLAAMRPAPVRAGAAVAAAAAVKVYPLAYGFVLAVLRPRTLLPLLAGAALAAALPFVLQDPGYVREQYAALAAQLGAEDRTGDPANAYRDLRLLGTAIGVDLPHAAFLALQALGGAALAGGVWWLQRRRAAIDAVYEFAFGGMLCWIMLLGPSTERVTYNMLAPALVWPLLRAWRGPWDAARIAWTIVNALFLLDQLLPQPSRGFQAAHPWSRCLAPFVAVLASGMVVWDAGRAGRTTRPT